MIKVFLHNNDNIQTFFYQVYAQNLTYNNEYIRVVFIKSVGKNNFNISQVGKTKRFKSLSIQDIYPFGSSFNINDTHIDIPVGSYLTYDENNVHGCYYKNKIILLCILLI